MVKARNGGQVAGVAGAQPAKRRRRKAKDGHRLTQISSNLRVAHERTRTVVSDALREFGVTAAQFGALRRIGEHDSVSGADLARSMGMTPQATHELILGLEAAGMVERTADPTNRRKRLVLLTTHGHDILGRCVPVVNEVQQQLASVLTAEECDTFFELLARYAGTLDD